MGKATAKIAVALAFIGVGAGLVAAGEEIRSVASSLGVIFLLWLAASAPRMETAEPGALLGPKGAACFFVFVQAGIAAFYVEEYLPAVSAAVILFGHALIAGAGLCCIVTRIHREAPEPWRSRIVVGIPRALMYWAATPVAVLPAAEPRALPAIALYILTTALAARLVIDARQSEPRTAQPDS